MYNFIIIGQGIAGTMLAWHLIKAGQKVLVIDRASGKNASSVASGVINPITGKRFVKSWKMDELLPFAVQTYQAIQAELQVPLFQHLPIFHILNSNEELNDWSAKTNVDGYEKYLSSSIINKLDEAKVVNPLGSFTVNESCKIESSILLENARHWLTENESFLAESFDESQLQFHADFVRYYDLKAERIIFANGYQSVHSPLFNGVKFVPVKGEGLLIEIEDFYTENIIHGDVMISPTNEKNIYYVGSTYEWSFEDAKPTAAKRNELIERIKKTIACDFKVLEHVSGIRPASKDRRPIIGILPDSQRIGIFNGLGTKGFSLAPFCANHFCNHLLNNKPLFSDVDVNRFF